MLQNLKNYITRSNVQFVIIACMVISFVWSNKVNSWFSITLALHYFIDFNVFKKLKVAFLNKQAWFFYAIFLWYAIWLLLGGLDTNAQACMERKIPFLLFPIILSSENYITQKRITNLLYLLLASCVAAAIVCEVYGYINYKGHGNAINYFVYQDLSRTVFEHPGHMSNYYALLIIWLTLIFTKNVNTLVAPSKLLIIAYIFLVIFLIQLTSKTIILFLLLFIPWLLFKYVRKITNANQFFKLSAVLVILCFSFFYFNKKIMPGRFNVVNELQNLDSNVAFGNSTGSRAMAIKEAFLKVKPVWYKGYGTGQAIPKLLEQLVQKNYTDLVKWEMHPHNQYMRTWLDIGFFGLLCVLCLFFYALFKFIKQKNYLAIWFVVLILVNLATDDMLEIQAGLVFFILWLSLFLFIDKKNSDVNSLKIGAINS